jgi:hypothetical protein
LATFAVAPGTEYDEKEANTLSTAYVTPEPPLEDAVSTLRRTEPSPIRSTDPLVSVSGNKVVAAAVCAAAT